MTLRRLNSALLLLIAATAATAVQAGPWNDAQCAAFAAKDLGGSAVALVANGDEQRLGTKLDAPAGSVFMANGYAVKVFTQPNFGGYGRLYSASEASVLAGTAYSPYLPTDGGYYVNLVTSGVNDIVSFACTADGTTAPIAMRRASEPFTFYNDRMFTLTGYRGNHVSKTNVTITNRDGKKLITATDIAYWGAGTITEFDLDTRAITVRQPAYGGNPATEQVVLPRTASDGPAIKLDYLGALTILNRIVDVVAANAPTGAAWYREVPNTELNAAATILHDAARF